MKRLWWKGGYRMLDYPPGWTCERTELRFESYILRTIPLEEALAAAEHLEACEGCAQRLVLFRVTIAPPTRG
jgi:hypothetical protein